jgi:hypothetical protein
MSSVVSWLGRGSMKKGNGWGSEERGRLCSPEETGLE